MRVLARLPLSEHSLRASSPGSSLLWRPNTVARYLSEDSRQFTVTVTRSLMPEHTMHCPNRCENIPYGRLLWHLRVILKCVLEKHGVKMWSGFNWLRTGPNGGLLRMAYDASEYTHAGNYMYAYVNKCQVYKNTVRTHMWTSVQCSITTFCL
jgi:hypothetical protein